MNGVVTSTSLNFSKIKALDIVGQDRWGAGNTAAYLILWVEMVCLVEFNILMLFSHTGAPPDASKVEE